MSKSAIAPEIDAPLAWLAARVPVWRAALVEKFGDEDNTAVRAGRAWVGTHLLDIDEPPPLLAELDAYVEAQSDLALRQIYLLSAAMRDREPMMQDGHNLGVDILVACRTEVDNVGSYIHSTHMERVNIAWSRSESARLAVGKTTRTESVVTKPDGTVTTTITTAEERGSRAGRAFVEMQDERLWRFSRERLVFLVLHAEYLCRLVLKNNTRIRNPRAGNCDGRDMSS